MTPALTIYSIENPVDEAVLSQLAALLPEFIAQRRWFRAKARTIQKALVVDAIPFSPSNFYILVIRLDYADSGSDHYLLPVTFGASDAGQDIIARYEAANGAEGDVYEALSDKHFRDSLLNAFVCNRNLPGRTGELNASRTLRLVESCGDAELNMPSFVSRAEQSNTSIVYSQRLILKLFRKIEPGINPDIEVGTFLTEHGFAHTPAVLGKLEYRAQNGEVYAAGILQQFVPNQGDAWKYTLESLSGFFERALAASQYAPALKSYHPMQLLMEETTSETQGLLGNYADSARLLGKRTAEMHAALADSQGDPDFEPEPFTSADGQKLYENMLAQADIAFELLRRKQAALKNATAENARILLRMEHHVSELFCPLRDQPVTSACIRFHGDYHLGQVLYTGSDFMIIDFEGEPARPLHERRAKALTMRDVAGMVRSFQYAAYAALFGQIPGVPMQSESKDGIESWAAFWSAWVSAIYLKSYYQSAEGFRFIPAGLEERRTLFDAFLLQKALYEVAYELNNRPDWVGIPLRGILSLIS